MNEILFINGNVRFPITIDPSVWIFDDRKVDLTTYFTTPKEKISELAQYTKEASKHWDREIREGAIFPPVNKSVARFEKEKIITGTFGIPFLPFLENAEISNDATLVEIHTESGITTISINEAKDAILGFSSIGKPLKEDGPVHLYFGDGSNVNNPIRYIRKFTIV
ncbi:MULTISPECIES: peptidyl-prolyl cis-trans isomerase [unclassified Bacillus (in: firmicutes)]|uniref:peptidyl-prolyl cis-trans isomerase n=1 Tax=unclassified Bacillus (in: firmicutes) TaxID=185979 RepID=UPI0023300205|nr:peptidyl-prolyl cis-trans isomerase [Bacillus sp. BP-3]MDC2864845.1 peptidyl-prolyl cis-trans isomerase [Bacillus sp. BP-3]